MEEFRLLGISFVSLSEAIDTETPLGTFFFTVVSAFGELERNIIRDRVREGVAESTNSGQAPRGPRRWSWIARRSAP